MFKRISLGMRCLKTVIATTLCAAVYFLIDRNPTFACIGAVFGMDSYVANAPQTGGNRSIGTIIGGFTGCVCFILCQRYPGNISKTLIMFFGLLIMIVICQLLNATGSVQAGSVVFFILLLNTPADNYMNYAINRMIDTLVGEAVAFAVNYIVPPTHHSLKARKAKKIRGKSSDFLYIPKPPNIIYRRCFMEKYEAIYARQSVDKKDSISIDSQISFCKREACTQTKIYSDRGFSGKNTNRPQFISLMDDVKKGLVSKIICYRIDRISRSILDFGEIWQTCKEHGVEFVSVNEKFDTSTPMGRAMLYIIMVFAQLERETIAERITDNYYERVKCGAWPGGPAPFGFECCKKDGVPSLKLGKDSETVSEIFSSYSEGSSLGKIAKELNSKGIKSPAGKVWHSASLGRILRNPCYVKSDLDVLRYYLNGGARCLSPAEAFDGTSALSLVGKSKDSQKERRCDGCTLSVSNHMGIVDGKTFLLCQNRLDGNRQLKNSGSSGISWLSGLLKCGYCGYGVKLYRGRQSKEPKIYLLCSGKTNYGICDPKFYFSLCDIEQAVSAQLEKYILPPQDFMCLKSPKTERLENEIKQIEHRIHDLLSTKELSSPAVIKYINREIEEMETERLNLVKCLEWESEKNSVYRDIEYVNFNCLDRELKKEAAYALIDKILLYKDGIRIMWK